MTITREIEDCPVCDGDAVTADLEMCGECNGWGTKTKPPGCSAGSDCVFPRCSAIGEVDATHVLCLSKVHGNAFWGRPELDEGNPF